MKDKQNARRNVAFQRRPDHVDVDAALGRLRGLTTVEQRLGVLRCLVEYWHGPIQADDGFTGADLKGFVLPGPLEWWLRFAGRRPKILSGQNKLLALDDLRIVDGRLQFYVENQYCYQWATEPKGDDPPVFGRKEESGPWMPEGTGLSEHLILACLFEAIMCHSPYAASAAWLARPLVDRIAKDVPPVPIAPWRWCGRMQFHAANGAFLVTAENGEFDGVEGQSVWFGAKTELALRFLKPFIDENWEHVAL